MLSDKPRQIEATQHLSSKTSTQSSCRKAHSVLRLNDFSTRFKAC